MKMTTKRLILTLLTIIAMLTCAAVGTIAEESLSDGHSSRDSLNWAGTYKGTVPGADSAIYVELSLANDNTYALLTQYTDKSDEFIVETGSFTWNEEGSIIHLEDTDYAPYYFVGENTLTQLDIEGQPITGELADQYILTQDLELSLLGDGHNALNSLDWAGTYKGTVPGANSAIYVELTLVKDNTYALLTQYTDKSDEFIVETGSFTWNEEGNTIHLEDTDYPPYYFVGENTLTQLDMEGQQITGDLAQEYILTLEPALDDGHSGAASEGAN
ncbi:hypothetical protein FACS1894184_10630 [Clostridia bacterium]|nr:hypothetical protein FACS1894184_10630 [Clostridia bacterium]